MERLLADGGGVGRAFLGVLDLPGYDAEIGDTSPDLPLGLAAGDDIDVVEGKS
jgi:hypothetical protein